MTRLSQSVFGGILLTGAFLTVIFLTDHGGSELPIVERHPFSWAFFWPDLLWNHVLNEDSVDIATIVTNVIIFTIITYRFLKWRENHKRLP